MEPTSLLWRGLTIGAGSRYRIRTLDGWEARPPGRYKKVERTGGHGTHRSRVLSDERIVTVEGWCWASADRDQLLADLQAVAGYTDGDDTDPLTVTAAGRTLTAGGQLLEARPMLLRGEWGVGRFGWLLQWRCPDPRRYGSERSLSTALPDAGGGLVYPLTYNLDYGAAGEDGSITLDNLGSADAPILLAVRGGHDVGFEVSAAGRRLTYGALVPAGQVVEIDSARGTVLVEGTASRRANLVRADWLHVPARSSLAVQFTSLGGNRDPGALLTATWAETHW
jgi:hypothetical protein